MTVNAGLTVAPAAIVTLAGTVTAALLEERLITVPPAGAAEYSVTVLLPKDKPPTIPPPASFNVIVAPALTVRVAVCETEFADAVIVDVEFVARFSDVAVKVAVVAPAATVTDAGTVAAEVLLDESATTKPSAGAALLRVTVPVEVVAPVTVVGFKVRPVRVGAVTARVAVEVAPPPAAEIVAVALVATATDVTVKVAVVAPDGMVTDAGTVAAALFEVNVTTKPFGPAALLIVTVPVEGVPPTTDVGLSVRPVTAGGLTVNVAVLLVAPVVPVIVTEVAAATPTVVAVNVAVLDPAATDTDAGTVVEASLEASVTVIPPVGAFALSVTVPVEERPPATAVGLIATELIVGTTTVSPAVEVPPFRLAVIVAIC